MVVTEPIIRLSGVTLTYGGDDVVRKVDLNVRRGETKVILGPSGVGKSTILKAILGILKPKEGSIYVHDRNIDQLEEKELVNVRLRMAMVFQNGALFDSMTVGENVSYRLREHQLLPETGITTRVGDVLKFVGLEGAMKLKPAQLSGGMKKRVALARAIALDPKIVFYDEPGDRKSVV